MGAMTPTTMTPTTTTTTGAPAPDRATRLGPLQQVWAVVRFVVGHALVDPIRRGSLRRSDEWPRHLVPVVVLGLIMYSLMTLTAIAAPWLRSTFDLTQWQMFSLPWVAVGVFIMALTYALALAYASLLHVNPWVRVPGLVLVIGLATKNPLLVDGPLKTAVLVVEIVVLVAFAAWRWRRPYSPFEVLVPLVVIGHGLTVRMSGTSAGSLGSFEAAAGVVDLFALQSAMLMWAIPAIFMAGAAKAELAISMASWGARGVWEAAMTHRRRREIGALLVVALVGLALFGIHRTLQNPNNSWRGVGSSLLLLAVTGAIGLAVLRFVPKGDRAGIQVDPDDLVTGWSPVSLWLAIAYTFAVFGPFPAAQVLAWWGISVPTSLGSLSDIVLFPTTLAASIWLARRDRPAAALLVAAMGIHSAYVTAANLAGLPLTTEDALVAISLAAMAVLAYTLVTRTLSADRGLAIGSVLLIVGAYPLRDFLDEPLTLLASVAGTTGGLILGLAWRQLTEYGFARRSSPGFPASSRVLLAVANLTLVATAIAIYACAAGSGTLDLGLLENIGDEMIGGSLLFGVCVAGLLMGVRGREGGEQRPGEEFQVFPILVEAKGPVTGTPPPWFDPNAPWADPGAPWFDQNVDRTRWR
ncbi:hypothetical protein GCM10027418_30300 [Mariniluteicoccus endophyticus]